MIPTTDFSALANALLPQIPSPNRAGLDGGNLSNASSAVPSISIKQNLWSYTLDHNISTAQSIHFTEWRDYVTQPYLTSAPIVPLSNELQSAYNDDNFNNSFLLNYVKTVNPHLVATVGADWIGYITNEQNAKTGVSFAGVAGSTTFPLVNFDGQNAPSSWGVNGGAYLECCSGGMTVIDNRRAGFVIANNWLWTNGRHTMNFGIQFRHTAQDILPCQFCSGTFNFSQRTTSIPNTNDPNFGSYGSSFASFLLGQADAGIRLFSNELYMRSKEFAPYFQDSIKINGRLTVDVGLRYDIMVPFTERNNNIIYVNTTEPDPGAGNIPGAATKLGNCTGCAGVNRADIHWRNFQPRLGFAYKLNNKTVLRSGFYLTFLDGGAYEYGTAQSASFMSDLLDGEFLRQSTGTSTPSYGSWDANPLPHTAAHSL